MASIKMGCPSFLNRKKTPADTSRRQSAMSNMFSSKSRPASDLSSRRAGSGSDKSPSNRRRKLSLSRRNDVVSDKKLDDVGADVGVGAGVGASRSAVVPSAAELEDVFKKFDANGDGKISRSELSELMKSLGGNATEEEVGAMVSEADLDGDGYIDLSEFVALNTDQTVSSSRRLQDLKDAFNVFDRDGNGSISPSELHHVLTSLQEHCTIGDCHNMIKGVDSNGDGQVSFDEFMAMMTNTSHNSWTTGLN